MEREIKELIAQVNLLKEQNSLLVARIQKLEATSNSEKALFPITEAYAIADLLGLLNKQTCVEWMIRISNSYPFATGPQLTQLARLCMSPTDRDSLEAAVIVRDLLNKDMNEWMREIVSLLRPGQSLKEIFYKEKQAQNQIPELYISRKFFLAILSGEITPEAQGHVLWEDQAFLGKLYSGFYPQTQKLLQHEGVPCFPKSGKVLSQLLKGISDSFRKVLACRQEKTLELKRQARKSQLNNNPMQPSPTPHREMEAAERSTLPSRTHLRPHSPHSRESGTSSCPIRKAGPNHKENLQNRPLGQPKDPKPWKPYQPVMLKKGNPRGHPSQPQNTWQDKRRETEIRSGTRGPNWNGTGRCVPWRRQLPNSLEKIIETSDTVSASVSPMLEVRHTVPWKRQLPSSLEETMEVRHIVSTPASPILSISDSPQKRLLETAL